MNGWQPIETAPKDGTEIVLFTHQWDTAHIAYWDWVDGPDDDGTGGFCAWHLKQDDSGAMSDGLLWPDEDWMPTHWMPLPDPLEDKP